jgi:hypothetical protein
MCPYTLRTVHLDAKQFYSNPFSCIAGSRHLTRYVVLDIEWLEPEDGRYKLAEAQVCGAACRELLHVSEFVLQLFFGWLFWAHHT